MKKYKFALKLPMFEYVPTGADAFLMTQQLCAFAERSWEHFGYAMLTRSPWYGIRQFRNRMFSRANEFSQQARQRRSCRQFRVAQRFFEIVIVYSGELAVEHAITWTLLSSAPLNKFSVLSGVSGSFGLLLTIWLCWMTWVKASVSIGRQKGSRG